MQSLETLFSMYDNDNTRKDNRRQKMFDKKFQKPKPSEEQRFAIRSKKEKKKQIEEIREEEIWEDWENYT
jgi:hypothetical protein